MSASQSQDDVRPAATAASVERFAAGSARSLLPSDPIACVAGVGRKKAEAFARLGVATVNDLLRLAPRRFEDRRRVSTVAEIAARLERAARPTDDERNGDRRRRESEGSDESDESEELSSTWVGALVSARLIRLRGGLAIVEAVGEDPTGRVTARWWNQPWLHRSLPVGSRVLLHGVAALASTASSSAKRARTTRTTPGAVGATAGDSTDSRAAARIAMTSPAVERVPDDREPHPGVGRLVPVHPLTTGLSAPFVRRAVWNAMPAADRLEDPLPASLLAEARVRDAAGPSALAPLSSLAPLSRAARDLHFPDVEAASARARARFAFDELLVFELMLARRRLARRLLPGAPFVFTPTLDRRIRARLPFTLTAAQEKAVRELRDDLERPTPMSRLLQGDVGSGKTLVAVYACLACVANGFQAAFLAPTEILARQHEATIGRMLSGSDVRVEALYGARRGKARTASLARVAAGEADLVVGTHAVISRDVAFRDLALVVVDEQHKFGVEQRRELLLREPSAGGDRAAGDAPRAEPASRSPHLLVMTATPIPRSLAMVVYGDLDLSILKGMPPGRGSKTTWVAAPSEMDEVVARVRDEVERGRQAFIVYPLVSGSERGAGRAAIRDATAGRDAWAKALAGHGVGLVHGRMTSQERMEAMEAFRRGALDVLVATVVVEVGVDVPNATVLVVEHAERFGLSQLHQLRGRVGRGKDAGLCVLVDRSAGGTPDRLRVLERTEDGFAIAEADLRLRGGGDLFGTRQHGAPTFSSARLPDDLPILVRAREAARRLLTEDPALASREHARLLTRVIEREAAAASLAGGG